ncbi:ornithine cyclodeaminase family protein [Rhodophyticola porphyridii]|uniref:Ornithine cyclodeaminase n=1 Tax=Rhodophyticola porphyridii TaxID=1852017 RepID=A0A3L9Y941_9RHOB|nr:ornithine cyclodeaminase [Rhodophyticola porphyridii]RMA42743.1 ornithine cyclodeaminase [Rhodophyticola porphyridii]
MSPEFIGGAAEKVLTWRGLGDAIEAGHRLPKAEITDSFLYRGDDTMLSRAAWIDGLGLLVKTATIFPGNPAQDRATVGGSVSLFNDSHGGLDAILDFHLVTKWKTAGDSAFAASKLARPDSRTILIVGAGTVGRSLWSAYRAYFPDAQFAVWNRNPDGAARFAEDCPGTTPMEDLSEAVGQADIVTSATMASDPVIMGNWLRPGQHIDLIGAYRPDMREADDTTLKRARIFVDSRETTIAHIGELKDPIARGVIGPDDVIADYYDLGVGSFTRRSDDEITLFKNGGGAHLDLMTSAYILRQVASG